MSTVMLCRICVYDKSDFVYLMNLCYDDNPASLFIKDILNITMEQDSAKLVICSTCNNVLSNFYQFYKMVKDAQERFVKIKLENKLDPLKSQLGLALKKECSIVNYNEQMGDDDDLFDIKIENQDDESSDSNFIPISKLKKNNRQTKPLEIYLTSESENVSNLEPMKAMDTFDGDDDQKPLRKRREIDINRITKGQAATNKLLTKYKLEEVTKNKKWLLNDEERCEVLALYVEMRCTKCPSLFATYKELYDHSVDEHGEHPIIRCCRCRTSHRKTVETHILYRHILQIKKMRKVRRIQDSTKSFPCDECEKAFKSAVHLKCHKKFAHCSSEEDNNPAEDNNTAEILQEVDIKTEEADYSSDSNHVLADVIRQSQLSNNSDQVLVVKRKCKVKKKQKTDMYKATKAKAVTKKMLSKYKLEEICEGEKWLLNEEQMDEMLSMYVEMKCSKCPTLCTTYKDLDEHSLKEHEDHPIIRCCRCRTSHRKTVESHILFRHILQIQKSKLVKCTVCEKMIKRYKIKDHMACHIPHDEREFMCEYCDARFATVGALNYHIKSVHSHDSYPCEECGKTFKNSMNLKNHKRFVHRPEDDVYLCSECGKRFRNVTNYTDHMNKHQGTIRRIKCHICFAVVTRRALSKHMRRHDPNSVKQCPQCPYKGLDVQKHIRNVHENNKPFVCLHCPMMFQAEKPMLDHIAARHTGIPRYMCEYCNKTFMSSGNYHSHCKRIHPQQYTEKKLSEARKKDSSDIPLSNTLKRGKFLRKNFPVNSQVRPSKDIMMKADHMQNT